MKYLFIIQGEGRGHLTQAISLSEILLKNGHEVVGALVGKSKDRVIPEFFYKKISTKVITYNSPNFVWNNNKTDVMFFKTVAHNITLNKFKEYFKSMDIIYDTINQTQADIVINFYELLAGLTKIKHNIDVPFISMAHQYLIMHSKYPFGKGLKEDLLYIKLNNWLSSYGSVQKLGLSFYDMDNDKRVSIVPPLLREELFSIEPKKEDYILTYILSKGFAQEITQWHYQNPEQKLHVFWDKEDAPEELVVDKTLTFHKINDTKFLKYLANCKAYVTTAGFESVCEAMYLNKHIMMIPAHYEQEINALDAISAGIGIQSKDFNISKILDKCKEKQSNNIEFRRWIESAEREYIFFLTEGYKRKSPNIKDRLFLRYKTELKNLNDIVYGNKFKKNWSSRYWS
jgi:uncharacterized protein (TIGR00661 family)